jgi:hypothetical protein
LNSGETKNLKNSLLKATPLPVYSINAIPLVPGIDFSDHLNYWAFGYPAIMVTDTSFYRNKHYHTSADTWQTLDYEKMAMLITGLYKTVLQYWYSIN